MQATMTGLKYKIQIKETKLGPESITIKIYKVNRKTYKFEPKPTITVYTDVDKFAQAIHNYFTKPPPRHQKGTADEQKTDSQRTGTANPN